MEGGVLERAAAGAKERHCGSWRVLFPGFWFGLVWFGVGRCAWGEEIEMQGDDAYLWVWVISRVWEREVETAGWVGGLVGGDVRWSRVHEAGRLICGEFSGDLNG